MLLKSKLHPFKIRYTLRGSSRKFPAKDSGGEKKAGARVGRSWEKLRKAQKASYCFTEKERCFSGFEAFVTFVKFNLTGYNIWIVSRNTVFFCSFSFV